ncbi:MAG: hypothetical protein K5666_01625 [Bacilli bacterium]|nr:hypothetical protein [Bacilli bacterium]
MKQREALNIYFKSVVPMSIHDLGVLASKYYETKDIEAYKDVTFGLKYPAFLLAGQVKANTTEFERVINIIYVYLLDRFISGKLGNVEIAYDLVGDDFERYLNSAINNVASNVKVEVPFKDYGPKISRIINSKPAYSIAHNVNRLTNK